MLNIKKYDSTIEGLTPEQITEKNQLEKEAKLIGKEIIYIVKAVLFISIIMLIITYILYYYKL